MCVSIPPNYYVAYTIGLLKGKCASEVMSFGKKVADGAKPKILGSGYCVSTVGLDEETFRELAATKKKCTSSRRSQPHN